jgi:hypothetical protein
MKESSFYQGIVEEGRIEEAHRILLRVGKNRFGGPPTTDQQSVIDAINDAARLEDLVVRAGQVGSWAELLKAPSAPSAAPVPTPRRGRRKRS